MFSMPGARDIERESLQKRATAFYMQISHVARRTVGQPEDLSDQPYILILVRGLCLKMYPHKGPDKGEHTLSAWGKTRHLEVPQYSY